jgi:membrane-bound metal-dependent hydrolase YbcI (DUF457 family)
MDPLTHIVVGRAVVAAAVLDEDHVRAVVAAAILGALAPDADVALAFAGWDRYVRAHQFGTHSLLGALTMACLAAVVVRLFARRSRYSTLLAAASAGAMSHIALDLVSGARIALGWPLLNRRVSWPLVAMADPWIIGICIAGVIAPLFIASIRSTRCTRPIGGRRRSAARFVIVTLTLFLAFKAVMFGLAIHRADLHSVGPSAIEARWGSLSEWFVFERSDGNLRSSSIKAGGGPPVVVMSQPLEAESTLVESSRALDTVRNFLAVHEFAFPTEHRDDNQRISLLWSDLRYCRPETALRSLRCDVWVGGVYDRDGRAITQEVTVGRMVQTRPLPQSGRTRN